jgi:sulfite reductase alpha subunit-like flavoprotein
LIDFASHEKRLEGIPYSIIEDDLPKIKPRHFSILNDPFGNNEKANKFKICFTVHKFGETKKEGFCTSFLKRILTERDLKVKVQFSHSNKVICFDQEKWLH